MFHKWCRIVADLSQNTEFLVDEDGMTFSNTLPALAGRQSDYTIHHSGLAKTDSNRLPLTFLLHGAESFLRS